MEPFPLSWENGFHVITVGVKVGIMPHWFVAILLAIFILFLLTTRWTNRAVAQSTLRCKWPCHKKLALFKLAIKYYAICHTVGVIEIHSAHTACPQPWISPASPGQSPNRKKQCTVYHGERLFAICAAPPPCQPIFSPPDQGSTTASTTSRPISVSSSPILGSSEGQLLSPSSIICHPHPQIICLDSKNDNGTPGYPTALPLSPLPNLNASPVLTVDPHAVFVYDAADSGDDSPSVNVEKESDSAITISDDDDTTLSVSDGDSESPLQVTTNPTMPATAVSSSFIIKDDSANEHSSHIFNDFNEDWGFPSIDDPKLITAIGHALDDLFRWVLGMAGIKPASVIASRLSSWSFISSSHYLFFILLQYADHPYACLVTYFTLVATTIYYIVKAKACTGICFLPSGWKIWNAVAIHIKPMLMFSQNLYHFPPALC